jgi:hypothetical protein
LAVYTTTARAAVATEDVMTAYLPIVLGQDAFCNGYDTYPDIASTTVATSVGASLPTFNLSPTNRRSHGTSNPSSAEGMRLSGRTSKDFRP